MVYISEICVGPVIIEGTVMLTLKDWMAIREKVSTWDWGRHKQELIEQYVGEAMEDGRV